MVIQEAFVCGRPLLVSDIGGMREKVRDGVDGVHVSAGNVLAWQRALLGAPQSFVQLSAGIRKPQSHQTIANAHLSSSLVEAQQ